MGSILTPRDRRLRVSLGIRVDLYALVRELGLRGRVVGPVLRWKQCGDRSQGSYKHDPSGHAVRRFAANGAPQPVSELRARITRINHGHAYQSAPMIKYLVMRLPSQWYCSVCACTIGSWTRSGQKSAAACPAGHRTLE
jgi:hypothetical protein